MQQDIVFRTREMQTIEAARGKPMDQLLRELYVDQGLTTRAIGEELGQNESTISRWLDRFGIRTRKPGPRPAQVA